MLLILSPLYDRLHCFLNSQLPTPPLQSKPACLEHLWLEEPFHRRYVSWPCIFPVDTFIFIGWIFICLPYFYILNINILFPSPFLQTNSHAWCLADGVRLCWVEHAKKHEMRTRVLSNKQDLRADGFVLKIPLNRLFPLQLRRCVSVDSKVARCKMCPCAVNRSGAHLCRRESGYL